MLRGEPAADEVAELLSHEGARIPVVNLCEAIDVCTRKHGLGEREVRDVVEPLLLTGRLIAVESDAGEAWRAAGLRARYYDRKGRALSLADCLLLAHAQIGRRGRPGGGDRAHPAPGLERRQALRAKPD